MATQADVIIALEKFELDAIEKQWSDDIWEKDFTSCPDDLPDEFAEKFSPMSYGNMLDIIDQANQIIHSWLHEASVTTAQNAQNDAESANGNSSSVGISWTLLQDIDYKKLLALLYYYIFKGQIHNQDINSVNLCMRATNFYFTLLMIPGSNVYNIFNVALFEKCLETFTLHKYLEIATGRKVNRVKSRRSDGGNSDEEVLDMDETLSLADQYNVLRQLNNLLPTFHKLLTKFSFKKYPEAVNLSLSHLAELTRLEKSCNAAEFFAHITDKLLAPLSKNAYWVMRDFCSNQHGRLPENIRLVLFYLMPNLTSIGGSAVPELNKLSQKELSNIRSVAVAYITDFIIPLGEPASLGLKILIQQICFNMLDRADYRPKATDMILTLLSKLPMNLYYKIVTWIFRLAMMEGAHHRVIGIELLSKLLYMKPGTTELSALPGSPSQNSQFGTSQNSSHGTSLVSQNSPKQGSEMVSSVSQAGIVSFAQPIHHVPLEYRRVMLAIILDRIRDEATIVKTRALSVIGELLGNKTSPTVKHLMEEIFVNPYANVSVIPSKNGSESNGFLKWKTFVAALDKVRENEISKKMIPSGHVIVNKIFQKCLDERVNVRKAALHVIKKIFMFSSKWMTNKNLELYGRHCRDPALSIRKDMVSSLTELMLFFPDHEHLRKLWIKEVVPQITDRESRVQEEVLQIFTHTIISKIVSYEKTRTPMDELPWKLLDSIARQKMRSFLVTACSLWKKTGCLSQSLIKTIKTHIETENNDAAWVLLSSISEYVDIETPQFVLAYYFNNIVKQTSNVGISYLALLTLYNCWHKLDNQSKESLRKEMYMYIENFSVPSTLMRLTVDIASSITVTLAKDEMTGKQEVAEWAGTMIEKAESHLQICLKIACDETFQCYQCVTVLNLLGNLCTIRPDKISNQTTYMLHDFLMSSGNASNAFLRKMRAATIIAAAKMALRSDLVARSLVSSFSELLSSSSDPVILINVIVAIADIGERYANLIEPLISSMCICLKSKKKEVKEMALILLIELLQEDYLKARGALVFHLLTLINDADPFVINIVKYYFTHCLIARHPYKMYELLLPALFHFNHYTKHPDYPEQDMAEAERMAFDLSGEKNHKKRMNIYQFMLSNIPDMVRIKCVHFICTVILNGVADNIIPMSSPNGEQLLFDALSVLLTKEVRIDYNELVKRKNEDGEEEDQRQNPLYKLGKQMFSAAQKKEIVEIIIPICCKLKKKLHQEDLKLLPYLHKFVRELVREYKDDMGEMFKEDKQFGIEILNELEKAVSEPCEEEDDEEEEAEGSVNGDAIEAHMSAVASEHFGGGRMSMNGSQDGQSALNTNGVVLKEAIVLLERLPPRMYSTPEDEQSDEVEKAAEDVANHEEALKRLSITLERLSSKYLKLLEEGKTVSAKSVAQSSAGSPRSTAGSSRSAAGSPRSIAGSSRSAAGSPRSTAGSSRRSSSPRVKISPEEEVKLKGVTVKLERLDLETIQKELGASTSGRKPEDQEEAVRKAAEQVVLPPPNRPTRKCKRMPSAGGAVKKTPERRNAKKQLVTSTPMAPADGPAFGADVSPVVDMDVDTNDDQDESE